MAYSLIEQLTYDFNWYFTDYYNRVCIAASGGGILPNAIVENDKKNDLFNEAIYELSEKFEVIRNENIFNQIENQDKDEFFKNFDFLASRGLYVYDKFDLNNPEDGFYILVAYPRYDTRKDTIPFDREQLSLIPKVSRPIIRRTNDIFYDSNFIPINLLEILNSDLNLR